VAHHAVSVTSSTHSSMLAPVGPMSIWNCTPKLSVQPGGVRPDGSAILKLCVLLLFVVLWRLIQDYLTAPWVLGEGLELHPLAAIFAVLVGGEVAGVMGMFLSVPVMAAVRIVWRNWRMGEAAEEAARPWVVR